MTINTPMKLGKIVDRRDPINPNATAETKALYRFLKALGGSKHYVLGCSELYHDWYTNVNGQSTNNFDGWIAASGKRPGLVHHDYTAITTPGIGSTRYANMRAEILRQAEMGAIIQLFHPLGNPTTGALDMEDPYGLAAGQNGDPTGGIAPIKSGGGKYAAWHAYLSDLCDFISGLVLSNGKKVPVIWRPFHEFTLTNYYWWSGSVNAANLILVWRDMVDYMVTTKGCNNVLFNQNWDCNVGDATYAWSNYYAGDNYVDLVGFDSYENSSTLTNPLTLDSNGLMASGFGALRTIAVAGNKPIMLNETGYLYAAASKANLWDKYTGPYIEDQYYACSSMLLWNSPFGPDKNDTAQMKASFTAMVNSPYCLTLDKLATMPVFNN